MYPMLIVFLVGWFGANWWPGQWVDAPPPGRGDPWWLRPVGGILGGIAAIAVAKMTNVDVATLLGVTTVLATGNVVGGIVGAAGRMSQK
jgi:hypothetical protein